MWNDFVHWLHGSTMIYPVDMLHAYGKIIVSTLQRLM